MITGANVRRWLTLLALLGSTSAVLACDDDDDGGADPEPAVATMRLTVGAQTVTVDADGDCTGCPLVLTNGAVVTAEWRTAGGAVDPVAIQGSRYRLNVVVPTNTIGLTFALSTTNSFSGTFTATGVTTTPIDVSFGLRDVTESENEFGPHEVATSVVAGG